MFNYDAHHEKNTEDHMTAQQEISDMACELVELRQKLEQVKPMVISAFKDGFNQSADWLTPVGAWYITETKQELESFLGYDIDDKAFQRLANEN